MPTIKHGSTVNKTDFWSRNCLKIAGTADFRRKNGISWISRAVLYIFSWKFWCEITIPKMWRSPIFEKHFFLAENAGNTPEKPVFWHFLEISSLVFPDLLHVKMRIRNAQNMAESDFWEKFFSAENAENMPEIAVFADFYWTFSLISLFFHTKTFFITNNANHQACFNCQ